MSAITPSCLKLDLKVEREMFGGMTVAEKTRIKLLIVLILRVCVPELTGIMKIKKCWLIIK